MRFIDAPMKSYGGFVTLNLSVRFFGSPVLVDRAMMHLFFATWRFGAIRELVKNFV
jgi:hypothetical protein